MRGDDGGDLVLHGPHTTDPTTTTTALVVIVVVVDLLTTHHHHPARLGPLLPGRDELGVGRQRLVLGVLLQEARLGVEVVLGHLLGGVLNVGLHSRDVLPGFPQLTWAGTQVLLLLVLAVGRGRWLRLLLLAFLLLLLLLLGAAFLQSLLQLEDAVVHLADLVLPLLQQLALSHQARVLLLVQLVAVLDTRRRSKKSAYWQILVIIIIAVIL